MVTSIQRSSLCLPPPPTGQKHLNAFHQAFNFVKMLCLLNFWHKLLFVVFRVLPKELLYQRPCWLTCSDGLLCAYCWECIGVSHPLSPSSFPHVRSLKVAAVHETSHTTFSVAIGSIVNMFYEHFTKWLVWSN